MRKSVKPTAENYFSHTRQWSTGRWTQRCNRVGIFLSPAGKSRTTGILYGRLFLTVLCYLAERTKFGQNIKQYRNKVLLAD